MPRAKEGHDQRSQAEADPFEDDVRAFGENSNSSAKPTARLRNPQSTLTRGGDSPTPGGEANGVWNQAPLIP